MGETILIIVGIIVGFFLRYLYHKLFTVIYFDFSTGCFKELVISSIAGIILVGIAAAFWPIALAILAVFIIIGIIVKKAISFSYSNLILH